MRILGVDVGIIVCGYCVCEVDNLNVKLLEEKDIRLKSYRSLSDKIGYIFEKLGYAIEKYNVDVIVAEKLYSHHRHPTTLGILAQVRGIVVLLAYQKRKEFREFSTTRVRKSFLGRGSGTSEQVKKMAENITGSRFKSKHTADAFSLVAAFANAQKFKKLKEFSQ